MFVIGVMFKKTKKIVPDIFYFRRGAKKKRMIRNNGEVKTNVFILR